MTGTAKVKSPKSDQEWVRNTEKRLGQTEHPTSMRAGAWVLSTDPDTGNLIASHVNGGSVILSAPPVVTADPDVVSTNFPHIKLTRSTNQNCLANTATPVIWEFVDELSTGWNHVVPGTDITIPTSGVYLVIYNLYWVGTSALVTRASLLVNGATRLVRENVPDADTVSNQSLVVTDTLALTAGTAIQCQAFSAGLARNIGTSGLGANAITSVSLTRLPVG